MLIYDLPMLNCDLPFHFPVGKGFEIDDDSTEFVQTKRVVDHNSTLC